jgi:hypothetical protein
MKARLSYFWEIPSLDEYEIVKPSSLSEIYDINIEDEKYNIQQQLEGAFQKMEAGERDLFYESLINTHKRSLLLQLSEYNQSELRSHVLEQKWEKILPLIDTIISQLENRYLSNQILDLIAAVNVDFEKMADYPLTLYEVVISLRALLVEVKIEYELRNYLRALEKAPRCKEILEFSTDIMETIKREGLPNVTKLQVQKIDEVNGRPIYRVD